MRARESKIMESGAPPSAWPLPLFCEISQAVNYESARAPEASTAVGPVAINS
jgi:hypothetical protein